MSHFLRDERGSLPFALLGAIVVGTIVVTLVAATITGQRTARFDREFTTVVQSADAGIQEATHRIVRGDLDDSEDLLEGSGTSDIGDTYTWVATRDNPVQWRVESTGMRPDGTTRIVEALVRDEPRFFVAAFADEHLEFRGGNSADSYGAVWDTGNGIVATNETIELRGNSTVDAVHLYNWDAYPDFTRCTQKSTVSGCDDVLATPDAIPPSARIGPRKNVGTDLDVSFIEKAIEACDQPLTSWTASVDGTVLGTPYQDSVLCYENVTFDANTMIAEGATVEIYVTGQISVTNHTRVNCAGCDQGNSYKPNATLLSLYSIGDRVTIGNHVQIAAGVYAPHASCEGNSEGGAGNAQTHLFGSMICDVIDNQGGWNFHYDDRLAEEGTGAWGVSSWREQPAGS